MTEHQESTGFLDRSQFDRLELRGTDRIRFLNGRVTCDVAPLSAGQGIYGFLPQIKGRILADVKVLAFEESLWLELPPGKGEEISEHLGKYILIEDVEIRPLDRVPVSLVGSSVVAILDTDLAETPLAHAQAHILGIEAIAVREVDTGPSSLPVPVQTLWVPPDDVTSLSGRLVEEGVHPLDSETWDRLRAEAGRPLYGQDYGEDNFPQETGIEDAVSYTKGCYLGQEVIARIHYRGGVNKLLRGLYLEGVEAADALGRAIVEGGREAGRVTSVAESPSFGSIGLAVLHKRVEAGARVELDQGGAAVVTALPFSSRPT